MWKLIIVDIGACWGEYSLILGKHFNKGSIYAIEGSYENYKILCNNISFKLNNVQNVKPYNYIKGIKLMNVPNTSLTFRREERVGMGDPGTVSFNKRRD